MMNIEEKAHACLTKAQTLKNSGNYKDAVTALQSLSDHGVQWGPVYVSAVDLLAELCFSQEQDVSVDRFFPAFRWNRIKLRGSQHLEEGTRRIVDITLKHLRAMNEKARINAMTTEKNPSEDELILAALSGVPPAQRAKERYLIPAENTAQVVGSELLSFNVIGHSKRLLSIYLDTAMELISHCQEYNLKRAIGRLAEALARFFKRFLLNPITPFSGGDYQYILAMNKELEVSREEFYKDKSATERVVQVFCHLLQTLVKMNNWHGAWTAMQCFTKVLHEITQRHDASRECQINAYLAMAAVFWKSSHYAFHAYCLGYAAFLMEKDGQAAAASRAVLATLCVPNANNERKSFARGSDSLFEKNALIAQLFFLQTAPDGNYLLQRLQRMQLLQRAMPEVLAFDELLRTGISDESTANKAIAQLNLIAQMEPSLDMYREPLRKLVIQRYLEAMAPKTTRVDVSSLQIWGEEPSEDVYIHVIEPFILNESGIAVEIDHYTKSFSFSNAAKTAVLHAFDALAERVDLQPPAPRKRIEIKPEHLQRVHDRSSILHRLQHFHEETAEARRHNAKKKEEAERENERQERIMNEERKREALVQVQISQGIAEYHEFVNQGRRKLVLRRLREKFKGFTAPDTLAQKGSSDFVYEVTALLADYLKRTTQEKTADVTKMNHFERACREIEVPKRKALEAEEAEKHKAKRAAARENFLIQHRKEFDKRQQDNQTLRKFLKEAALFSEQTQTKGKATKRDEQMMLLQQERERLQGL